MNNKKSNYIETDEKQHFRKQGVKYGASWWGQKTPAGENRFKRKEIIVRSILKEEKCKSVLEVGCGSQPLCSSAGEEKFYTACDLTFELLELAKKNAVRNCFLQADVQRLPFKDKVFDAIIGNGILHHVELISALSGIKRILKENGIIIFFEPSMLNPQIFAERKIDFFRKLHQTEKETAFYKWRLIKLLQKDWKEVDVRSIDFLHPSVPRRVVSIAAKIGLIFEKIPVIREFAGSLFIYARNKK